MNIADSNKIIEHFGAAFYDELLIKLEKYTKQWQLSGLEQVDYYSANAIFMCVSAVHGACVLKIGPHIETSVTENYMLREYDGNILCRVYEADAENGALLIERIIPGTQLRDEPDLDARLNVFCEVFQGLHKSPSNAGLYPTYLDWVTRITAYMQQRVVDKSSAPPKSFTAEKLAALSKYMARAEDVCRELWVKYRGEMLLHGDLHHENILYAGESWRIIDPQGVIGDSVFDIPRFILNEKNLADNYAYISQALSQKLGVCERDIAKLFYVETCMAHCWMIESDNGDEIDMDDVRFAEEILNEVIR